MSMIKAHISYIEFCKHYPLHVLEVVHNNHYIIPLPCIIIIVTLFSTAMVVRCGVVKVYMRRSPPPSLTSPHTPRSITSRQRAGSTTGLKGKRSTISISPSQSSVNTSKVNGHAWVCSVYILCMRVCEYVYYYGSLKCSGKLVLKFQGINVCSSFHTNFLLYIIR